jgi:anti-sigma-K factor RskA
MNLLQPEARLQALAREYALGTLHGGARRRFEQLLRGSARAEHAVLAWQQQLGTLAAVVPPLAPSEQLWRAIEQRLFPKPAVAPWWRVWRVWLSGRVLGGALAGVFLAVPVLREQPGWIGLEPTRETLPASYVGLLHDSAGKPTLLASSRRHGRVLTVKLLQPLAPPAGRHAVLWALPKDGAAPFPVGVVPTQGSGSVALADSAEKIFFSVSRLTVSYEPVGAAPATPGAAFVLQGDCVKLW